MNKGMLLIVCMACATVPAAAAAPKSMTLAEYMSRSDALALRRHNASTPEYMRLTEEVNGALWNVRQERRIARKEGRAPRACLPPGVPPTTNREVAVHFNSIPAERRASITVTEALMQLMERKFPCAAQP